VSHLILYTSDDGRADASQPKMNLTSWSESRVPKLDVIVAKNYLSQAEIDTLNRLVVTVLERADPQVKQRNDLTLDLRRDNVDKRLEFNDRPVQDGPGTVSHDDIKRHVHDRFEVFDQNRREGERLAANANVLRQLVQIENEPKRNKKGSET